MRLLNSLRVLADLSSEDWSPHNLGPKYRSECLPYVTELYLGMEKSEILSRSVFFKNIANNTWA